MAELEKAHAAWPVTLAAWDKGLDALRPIWDEMVRVKEAERVARKKVERLDQSALPVMRVPDVAGGDFPISATLVTNLHWTPEAYSAERRAERDERERQRAEWHALAGNAGRVGPS